MAVATNSIAQFFFCSLEGNPVPPYELVGEEDRPGVLGTEFQLMGTKGEAFQLVSKADVDSYEEARQLLRYYQDLTKQGAVELVQGGISSTDENYKVKVVRVSQMWCGPIVGAVGNKVSELANAMIICRWELKSVPAEEDETSSEET
jgi:hypothetical protein